MSHYVLEQISDLRTKFFLQGLRIKDTEAEISIINNHLDNILFNNLFLQAQILTLRKELNEIKEKLNQYEGEL